MAMVISKAQQKAMIKRTLARSQPQAPAGGIQQNPEGVMSSGMSGPATQSPDAGSFGQPTGIHDALMQAEGAWGQLQTTGQMIWRRIHPEVGKGRDPQDSFMQQYTKYLLNPESVSNPRVKSFMDHVSRQQMGDAMSIQAPEEENPALQALSLGDPNASV